MITKHKNCGFVIYQCWRDGQILNYIVFKVKDLKNGGYFSLSSSEKSYSNFLKKFVVCQNLCENLWEQQFFAQVFSTIFLRRFICHTKKQNVWFIL